jgi:hypothetical protein
MPGQSAMVAAYCQKGFSGTGVYPTLSLKASSDQKRMVASGSLSRSGAGHRNRALWLEGLDQLLYPASQ